MSDRIPNRIHYAANLGPTICGKPCPANRFKTTFPAKVTCVPCRDILVGAKKKRKRVRHLKYFGDGALCNNPHVRPASLTESPREVNCTNCLLSMERRNRTGDW